MPGRRGALVDARLSDYVRGQWPALVRYATALCGNSNEGEELVQSALVRVTLRWALVRDKDNPDAYVRRAILHGYLNVRRRIRLRETSMAELPELPGVDETAGVADGVAVRRALQAPPPRARGGRGGGVLENQTGAQTTERA